MKVLDIGCGKHKYEGAVGIDKFPLEGVDVVHDIEKGLPFQDNEFDLIICTNVLEYVKNFVFVMEEIWRVGKPNAVVKIKVPYFSSPAAFNDPGHVRFFTWLTFNYFTEDEPINIRYFTKAKFGIVKRRLTFQTGKRTKILRIFDFILNFSPMFYQRFFAYVLPAGGLEVELKIVK
jgi:SAM-dependent methyltransferase